MHCVSLRIDDVEHSHESLHLLTISHGFTTSLKLVRLAGFSFVSVQGRWRSCSPSRLVNAYKDELSTATFQQTLWKSGAIWNSLNNESFTIL
jgi:hypothetical protein